MLCLYGVFYIGWPINMHYFTFPCPCQRHHCGCVPLFAGDLVLATGAFQVCMSHKLFKLPTSSLQIAEMYPSMSAASVSSLDEVCWGPLPGHHSSALKMGDCSTVSWYTSKQLLPLYLQEHVPPVDASPPRKRPRLQGDFPLGDASPPGKRLRSREEHKPRPSRYASLPVDNEFKDLHKICTYVPEPADYKHIAWVRGVNKHGLLRVLLRLRQVVQVFENFSYETYLHKGAIACELNNLDNHEGFHLKGGQAVQVDLRNLQEHLVSLKCLETRVDYEKIMQRVMFQCMGLPEADSKEVARASHRHIVEDIIATWVKFLLHEKEEQRNQTDFCDSSVPWPVTDVLSMPVVAWVSIDKKDGFR